MKELERNSSTSKTRKWILRIFAFRINYGNYLYRDLIRDSMMICDDHIDAQAFGMTDRLDISGSTVDGDNQRDSFCLELIEKI